MFHRKLFILSFVFLFFNAFSHAQETHAKPDSTVLYKNIEKISKRSKFNSFLYRLIFKPISGISKSKGKKAYKKLIQKSYITFQGKIIRRIDIVTLDPFGFSIADTSVKPKTLAMKAANSLHIKTQTHAIRNLLLIHENEPFNSFFVKESERLIRNQKFVHEVSFYVTSSAPKSDSVDIFIRVLDIWSLRPMVSVTPTRLELGFTDRNFLGTGDEFQNIFKRNISTGINAFHTNYFIPDIKTSYISSNIHYQIDGYGNIRRSLAFERPFYSSYAKWAGGISLATQVKKDSLTGSTPEYIPLNLKIKRQDIWGAKAIRIFKDPEDENASNLIFSARYLRIRYLDSPSEIDDPLKIYSNEDFYMVGVGISTRKYVQDTYIFKFGTIEDVPIGKVIQLTGGYQLREKIWRPYLGMRFSFGSYTQHGYLSTNIEYGTFFNGSQKEQGVVDIGINYFTGLFEIGKWKFRQFIKPQVTIGSNRSAYDTLTLNDGYGLDGFNSRGFSGTKRLLLTLQTQSYSPWNLLGFHFGPFLVCSMGILGDGVTGFKKHKLYSQFGLGVLIKNENLVFNTFQVSVSFYPVIPGYGYDVMKLNSYRTTDFGFRNFEIGKPDVVMYR
jgi:hypothetical protein